MSVKFIKTFDLNDDDISKFNALFEDVEQFLNI